MIPGDSPLGLDHAALRGPAVVLLTLGALAGLVSAFSPRAGAARPRRVPAWAAVLGAALAMRAALSLVQDGHVFDVLVAYRDIGERVLHGADIWSGDTESLATYPPPVYGWWAVAALIPGASPHVFAALVRAPFWVVDAGIAVALLRLLPGKAGAQAAWIYALCPVAAAVPTLHGQHDPVTDALLLAGVVVAVWRGDAVRGGLIAGAGIALKQWPVFFLPPILAALSRRSAVAFTVAAATPILCAYAAYGLLHPHDATTGFVDVATYRPHRQGLGTSWAFPASLPAGVFIVTNLAVTLGAAAVATALVRSGRRVEEALAVDMLLLTALSPTVSDQYLMWSLPFLLLAGRLRTAALLSLGLLPAVASLDLWTSVGDGDTATPLLALATAATLSAAAWLLMSGPSTAPAGHAAGAARQVAVASPGAAEGGTVEAAQPAASLDGSVAP